VHDEDDLLRLTTFSFSPGDILHNNVFWAAFGSPAGATNWRRLSAYLWPAFCAVFLLLLFDLVFLQHGRIPNLSGYSIRKTVFSVFFALFACLVLAKIVPRPRPNIFILVLALGIPFVWATVGFSHGYPTGDILNDTDGHFYYLAYFPLIAIVHRFGAVSVLNTIVIVFTLFSVACAVVYIAALTDIGIAHGIEQFLREGQFGFLNVYEDGRQYRLFLKSYVFLGIFTSLCVFLVSYRLLSRTPLQPLEIVMAVLFLFCLVNSFTRSLWLSSALAILVLFISINEWNKGSLTTSLPAIVLMAIAIGIVAIVLTGAELTRLGFSKGTILYRLDQAEFLFRAIANASFTGSGFGAPFPGNGLNPAVPIYTAELDILNLIRKVGLIGGVVYFVIFMRYWVRGWRFARSGDEIEIAGLYSLITLTVVFTMGMFNPYITSSLGTGPLVIAMAILDGEILRK